MARALPGAALGDGSAASIPAFRERSSRVARNYLLPAEAQLIVAQNEGFGSWNALIDAPAAGAQPVPAFAVDLEESRLAPRRHLGPDEWETVAAVVEEHGLTAIEASGLMTDETLARLTGLQTVTIARSATPASHTCRPVRNWKK